MFPENTLQSTPHAPGVYLMLDEKSKVIYVGKAKDLYKRLSSYARHNLADYNKTAVMLKKVAKVDTIITATEKEALILEASLIKKHKPRYNIILRDDKNYPYIVVTVDEEWPRVMMSRRKKKDKHRYFGPYSSSTAMWTTLRLILSLFPLRHCKGERLQKRSRPCLNAQMGKCLAPCVEDISPATYKLYADNVKNIIMLLEGKNRDLIKELTAQMQKAASEMLFERAAALRDQIGALSKTLEKQLIAAEHSKNQDIFGFARKGTTTAIHILFVRDGLINGSRSFFIDDPYGEDDRVLSQSLSQFYSGDTPVPKEILIPFEPTELELLREYFSDLEERKVDLKIPQRGDNTKLIDMANANALQMFEEVEKKKKSWQSLGNQIMEKLHLKTVPETIECLDISNISGQHAIGSLVSFKAGEPNKPGFRHYKIRTIEGPNDYGMMKEVLERRFRRGIEENNLPDLFVVDGGKGQLSMAMDVAESLGITDELDWIGIAKEREEEGEKLYKPGRKNPIILPYHNPVLLYLMRIRDESHRYGVTFHRRLRNKATLSSELDAIEGIGARKKQALLTYFGSLKKVKEASLAELQGAPGIGQVMAKNIYEGLHKVTLE